MWSRRPVGWQDGRRRRDGAEQNALRAGVRVPMRTQRADESSAPHCVPASSVVGYFVLVLVLVLVIETQKSEDEDEDENDFEKAHYRLLPSSATAAGKIAAAFDCG